MDRGNRPRLLVVGGQSRNVGKTTLVVDLIRAFPEARWVAVKITQHGHGACSAPGKPCHCAAEGAGVALDVETDRSGRSDTSRFLAAGARRALWLRTRQGQLGQGWPLLLAELDGTETGSAPNVIVESNSVLGVVSPDLYMMVLDSAAGDFKESARKFLHCADAFVVRSCIENQEGLAKASNDLRPTFCQPIGEALPIEAAAWVRLKFFGTVNPAND